MKKLLIMLFMITLVSMSFIATPVIGQFQPQPEPPKDLILELTMTLQGLVEDADSSLFRGVVVTNTEELRSALVKKIHKVCMMFEMENWYGGYHKLNKDIKPKLWNPLYDTYHKRSWLNPLYEDVFTFVERCQGIIDLINMYLTDGTD